MLIIKVIMEIKIMLI